MRFKHPPKIYAVNTVAKILALNDYASSPMLNKRSILTDYLESADYAIKSMNSLVERDGRYDKTFNQKLSEASNPIEAREQALYRLGEVFLEAALWGHTSLCKSFIVLGFPINFQHPVSCLLYTSPSPRDRG